MPISVAAPSELGHLAGPLRELVTQTLKWERRRAGEIAILLADDEKLRELNRQWRGIDRATDVISFAFDENEPDAGARPVTGDIAVSMDRVRAQAKRFHVREPVELARLVIHGTLHLAGHDHAEAAERRIMRAREESALRAVKVVVTRLGAAMRREGR